MPKKLKMAVLHVNSARLDATSPTMRIARFTADTLGIPLICNEETANAHVGTKFDVLFVKFGLLMFSGHRAQALQLYADATRIINLENDYTFKPDSRFRRMSKPYEVWSTVPQSVAENGGAYINWNVLTWLYPDEAPLLWRADRPLSDTLFYHGAYKAIRESSFKKFLDTDLYPIHIGTHVPNRKKWLAAGYDHEFISLRNPLILQDYGGTVYMEDDYSHSTFCSLGNRFYECLQLGIPMFIDAAALPSFVRAGLYSTQVADWVVSNSAGVKRLLRNSDAVREGQRRLWQRDYTAELSDQLKGAVSGL